MMYQHILVRCLSPPSSVYRPLDVEEEALVTASDFAASGVQLAQTHPGDQFTFRRAAFLIQLQSKVGLSLPKAAALRININLDGAPIASKSHTHPSHSQTSRLLTSSLSLGVHVPRPAQCVRGE
jgi:hypothetical protein